MPGGNLEDRLAALSATATDEDGVVTVTVGSSGVVTGLRLDDRVQRLGGATLSAEILRTMRRAQAALAEQVAVAVDETVGAETEDGKAVLDSYTERFLGDPEEPPAPVMPSARPFPTFENTPTLPHQSPGNGYESGRDSRAR
ncbi:YbaB/EbfC family nucleoid-associated protein [Actinoplanes sp. Pm04-4]|uniref:YbaB/EbfC family nucleoid-associated protein n=1 Tax=Paractinoplanes pyxinae TaxID=2997416 RepID=A0ABT4B8L3_9ACTN|nr:YbaB/EbfC family nucleoid-associated protein [Actinoplanes pyxinae]MCY1142844.1 YbaB/EbfC family nucleoid-associated protein [Actinoplanes pyxinae]